MTARLAIEVHKNPDGYLQLSIGDGQTGYRFCGPRFIGNEERLLVHYLSERDREEIRSWLKRTKPRRASALTAASGRV